MSNPDPNSEDILHMILEAYERIYQANRGKYLSVFKMRDAIKDELYRQTNCHVWYPDNAQLERRGILVETPESIQMVVLRNVGVYIIDPHGVTEAQLHAIRQQIEQGEIPVGAVIIVGNPAPRWEEVGANIPLWQRQAMDAISWDEE